MSDGELRDELVTLLLAATRPRPPPSRGRSSAWSAIPTELERLLAEIDEGGEEYLEATVNETLRVQAGGADRGAACCSRTWRWADMLLPAGTRVAPCIYLTNRNPRGV